jgi:hypothetical protein
MRTVPAEQAPRVEPIAWLALLLTAPAMSYLLVLALASAAYLRDSLVPRDDGLKATLYSADAGDTFRTVTGLSFVAAAAAVGLGMQALRLRRTQPSAPNTQIARASIIIGLLFLPLALVLLLLG